jgi:hypothetical protein
VNKAAYHTANVGASHSAKSGQNRSQTDKKGAVGTFFSADRRFSGIY